MPIAGTKILDWPINAQCWYQKLCLVGLCPMLVLKTLIGGSVPNNGT